MAKYILSLIAVLLSQLLHAQVTINGTVSDAGNGERLAYVNIGIRNKNIGTVSDINGVFTLGVPTEYLKDTLTLSEVGYEDLRLPVAGMTGKDNDVKLQRMRKGLPEVVCKTSSLKEVKYGLWHYAPLLHFLDGSIAQNDAFEIAQLIKFSNSRSKITSLNLHINDDLKDSATFRINFYSYDGRRPGTRIVEKSVVQTKAIKEGWMRFDLAKYNIYLKGPVVVGIEFMPGKAKQERISYEIKPGGRDKSFVRTSSQGTWQVPPHQYRIFATALATNGSRNTEEPKDISPAFTLFSKKVQDSFSIYVRLPRHYNITRHYPVAYVLDANVYFPYLSDSLDRMKRDNVILVGIGYRDLAVLNTLRDRDYTYPAALPSDSFTISGGGLNFHHFLRDELVPFIDSAYRTDKLEQHLMGHSLGGYFVLFALLQEIQAERLTFTHFVSASPSVEYHDMFLADQFGQLKTTQKSRPEELSIAWGNEEEKDADGGALFSAAIKRLFQQATNTHFGVTKMNQEKYPGADHMETALPTFYKALTAAAETE